MRQAVQWICDGNPEFELNTIEKEDRGTEIKLTLLTIVKIS